MPSPPERGAIVFRLELPLELAPTLNVYANMKGWKRGELRSAVDGKILEGKKRWGSWRMGVARNVTAKIVDGKIRKRTIVTGGRRRLVVFTRESSREPDELAVDILGGKIPIDRLAMAGVLRGDSRKWLARESHWVPAMPKQGRVVVEIYELDEVFSEKNG